MRIIAGQLKGRSLHIPRSASFRPTTDRVKESVFNILASHIDWPHASVCDLFAGSGNLGIEAFSRGAASVHFVERHRSSLAVLERNLRGLTPEGRLHVVPKNVERFLTDSPQQFELILADPPYAYGGIEQFIDRLPCILAPAGTAVVEHDAALSLGHTTRLRVCDHRTYGHTAVTFFEFNHGDTQ